MTDELEKMVGGVIGPGEEGAPSASLDGCAHGGNELHLGLELVLQPTGLSRMWTELLLDAQCAVVMLLILHSFARSRIRAIVGAKFPIWSSMMSKRLQHF